MRRLGSASGGGALPALCASAGGAKGRAGIGYIQIGRGKEIGGGGNEQGGSDLVQLGLRANGYLLCLGLSRRSALTWQELN